MVFSFGRDLDGPPQKSLSLNPDQKEIQDIVNSLGK